MANEVTTLLHRAAGGDSSAADALYDLVYARLRAIAGGMMRTGGGPHTLQPTALVNEAWLRMHGSGRTEYENRVHFMAVAARAMRSILIDHARRGAAAKRGGGAPTLPLLQEPGSDERDVVGALDLDDALTRLHAHDPEAADIVTLRYFGGLTLSEVADHLELSKRHCERRWSYARAWLHRALT